MPGLFKYKSSGKNQTSLLSIINSIPGIRYVISTILVILVIGSLAFYQSRTSEKNLTGDNSKNVNGAVDTKSQPEVKPEQKTPAKYIQNEVVTASDTKILPVPYFNQCLESDQTTLFPNNLEANNREVCRNMCSAAVMVMVGGYYKKLTYDTNNPQSLKKYMYSNSGQDIDDNCGINQGGAFGLIATETDVQLGKIACNGGGIPGMEKYALGLGMYTKSLNLDIGSIKSAIDRGHPVILGTKPHIIVIKGYKGDKLIANDPYNNATKDSTEYNYNGFDAEYDLAGILYFHNIQPFIYALEVSDKQLDPEFKFKNGDKVSFKGTTDKSPLSVRQEPCNIDAQIIKINQGSSGVIIDQPKFLEFCTLSQTSKNWYKIKWSNGVVGWSLETYLSK